MDPLGIIPQFVITPIQAAPAPAAALPVIGAAAVDQVDISNAQAVQAALQPKAQIADTEILGTGTEVTFMVGGQLYTRQTKIVDGLPHSTYIPQDPLDIKA
jgi:hypothetical protein